MEIGKIALGAGLMTVSGIFFIAYHGLGNPVGLEKETIDALMGRDQVHELYVPQENGPDSLYLLPEKADSLDAVAYRDQHSGILPEFRQSTL